MLVNNSCRPQDMQCNQALAFPDASRTVVHSTFVISQNSQTLRRIQVPSILNVLSSHGTIRMQPFDCSSKRKLQVQWLSKSSASRDSCEVVPSNGVRIFCQKLCSMQGASSAFDERRHCGKTMIQIGITMRRMIWIFHTNICNRRVWM